MFAREDFQKIAREKIETGQTDIVNMLSQDHIDFIKRKQEEYQIKSFTKTLEQFILGGIQ